MSYLNGENVLKSNVKDTNYFAKKFTNCWCGKWLLVNEKVILIVGLDDEMKTSKKFAIPSVCKNVIK